MPTSPTPRCSGLVLLLAAGALGGCVDLPGQDKPKASKPVPRQPAGATTPTTQAAPDRVTASATRERALQTIEELAVGGDPQTRANAVEAASFAPTRLADVIAKGLRDANPAVRSVAAQCVGRTKLTDLAGEVSPLLTDPTPHVRLSAIYAQIALGQDADRTPLASALLENPSPWVRRHAAFILGELGDPSAISLLRAALRDPYPTASAEQVRALQLQIAEAMAKLGDANSRQVLRAALYPSRPEELEAAALAVQILGEIQDRDAIDQLIYLAEYRDRTGQPYPAEVRLGIAAALAGMGLPQGRFIADEFAKHENPVLRAQAAFVYGRIGGRESWERLAELLNDPNPAVRVSAAAGILRSSANR
ncbi:MAG: hypothetical protein HBSAPP03_25940 [Phycisphaerae bacterium]|nr:MAG: hypothetical protein HBSAPP03_25940 [Phycisphaerae bacterium]